MGKEASLYSVDINRLEFHMDRRLSGKPPTLISIAQILHKLSLSMWVKIIIIVAVH